MDYFVDDPLEEYFFEQVIGFRVVSEFRNDAVADIDQLLLVQVPIDGRPDFFYFLDLFIILIGDNFADSFDVYFSFNSKDIPDRCFDSMKIPILVMRFCTGLLTSRVNDEPRYSIFDSCFFVFLVFHTFES